MTSEDRKILEDIKNKNAIILLNKSDIKEKKIEKEELLKIFNKPIIQISALKKEGIEDLYNTMEEMFKIKEIGVENTSMITNIRHKEAIRKAKEEILKIKETINKKMPIDITAIYFKEAIEELNKITGENVTEDIINEIFSKFCLGK